MKRGLKCLAKMLSAIPVYPDITQKRHSKVLFLDNPSDVEKRAPLSSGGRLPAVSISEVIKQCGYLVGLQLYCSSQ